MKNFFLITKIYIPILIICENENYDLKRIKIEGFESGISVKELPSELVKKVNLIVDKNN